MAVARIEGPDRKRLAQLLGMIGSGHDGEALNAARLANRLVQKLQLQWNDVLGLLPAEPNEADYRSGLAAYQSGVAAGYQRGLAEGYRRGFAAGVKQARPQPRRPPPPPPPPEPYPWQVEANSLLQEYSNRLSQWEHDFLKTSIGERLRPPTEKQEAVLQRIRVKCGVAV
jgi:hypothetical protein